MRCSTSLLVRFSRCSNNYVPTPSNSAPTHSSSLSRSCSYDNAVRPIHEKRLRPRMEWIPLALHHLSHPLPSSLPFTMSVKLLSRVNRLPAGRTRPPILIFRPRGDIRIEFLSIPHIPYCHFHTLFVEPCCAVVHQRSILCISIRSIALFYKSSALVDNGARGHL